MRPAPPCRVCKFFHWPNEGHRGFPDDWAVFEEPAETSRRKVRKTGPRNRKKFQQGQAHLLSVKTLMQSWPPTQPRLTAKMIASFLKLDLSERQIQRLMAAIRASSKK